MSVVALVIDQSIADKYKERRPDEPEAAMAATLAKFADVDPGADSILLSKSLAALRAAVSTKLTDEEDVEKLVTRGGTIALKGAASGVYLALTPIQKKRLREEAERLGVTEIQALQGALKEAVLVRFGPF